MDLAKISDEFMRLLRLRTYPVAVKYFTEFNEDIEADLLDRGFVKPGEPLTVCQIVALARYHQRSSYFTAEDMACIVGAVSQGMHPPSADDMEWGYVARTLHKDLESTRKFLKDVTRIKHGEVKAVACSPLHKTLIDPDQIIFYGNSLQTLRLIQGHLWDKDEPVRFKSFGEFCLCSDIMAKGYITKSFVVGIPCMGERTSAMTGDDELTVGIPLKDLNRVLEGIRATADVAPYPVKCGGLNRTPIYFPEYLLTEHAKGRGRGG
jgi:uncharacterized protein (DUF169 family)